MHPTVPYPISSERKSTRRSAGSTTSSSASAAAPCTASSKSGKTTPSSPLAMATLYAEHGSLPPTVTLAPHRLEAIAVRPEFAADFLDVDVYVPLGDSRADHEVNQLGA